MSTVVDGKKTKMASQQWVSDSVFAYVVWECDSLPLSSISSNIVLYRLWFVSFISFSFRFSSNITLYRVFLCVNFCISRFNKDREWQAPEIVFLD